MASFPEIETEVASLLTDANLTSAKVLYLAKALCRGEDMSLSALVPR